MIEDARPLVIELRGLPFFAYHGVRDYEQEQGAILSYAAFSKHCSLFPASGAVMDTLGDALAPYFAEKATLRFSPAEPIPRELLERLIAVRVREVTV